jgi:serine-type D-Ala-D-Ala carboxypeptidase (penicillin-binding protein 5/6)
VKAPGRRVARVAAPAAFLLAATIAVLPRRPAGRRRRLASAADRGAHDHDAGADRTRSRRQPQRIYTVQSGDTLDEIAHEHGATVEQLLGLNPSIEPTELRPRPAPTRALTLVFVSVRFLAAPLAALALASSALAASSEIAPSGIDARAFLVVDGATGEVVAGKDAGRSVPIASITKLMTVLVALERARLDDVATVQPDATTTGGSVIGLRAGEQIAVRDLVTAALIHSANDAAHALADHVGGNEERFVSLMNARARELGLRRTHFVRPDGLDAAGHYSSARDVTILARVAMQKPFLRATVRRQEASIAGGRSLYVWNDLLRTFPNLIGVKTGHTSDAGWCQVAAAQGRGVTIYATLLGGPSRGERNEDLARLLRFGLSRYRVASVVSPERVYASARTQWGRGPVELMAKRPVRRALRLGTVLVERVVAPSVVALPVRKGQALGEVRVYAGPRLVARSPLVAHEAISRPGFPAKVAWYGERVAGNIAGWFT